MARKTPNQPDLDRPDWQAHAACLGHPDPDLFYGPEHESRGEREAREAAALAICRRCPVRPTCLLDALDRGDPHGIWGGTTPRQRERLRTIARRLADNPAA